MVNVNNTTSKRVEKLLSFVQSSKFYNDGEAKQSPAPADRVSTQSPPELCDIGEYMRTPIHFDKEEYNGRVQWSRTDILMHDAKNGEKCDDRPEIGLDWRT